MDLENCGFAFWNLHNELIELLNQIEYNVLGTDMDMNAETGCWLTGKLLLDLISGCELVNFSTRY